MNEQKPSGGMPQGEQREDGADQGLELREAKEEITKQEREATKKQLITAIHEVLKPAGFKRKGAVWRREINDIVQVVFLQRSYLGFEYFLEIGIFEPWKKPGVSIPDIADCQYRERVETHQRENLLDFENDDIPASERINLIAERLIGEVLPFFEANSSTETMEANRAKASKSRQREKETEEARLLSESLEEIMSEAPLPDEEKETRARQITSDVIPSSSDPKLKARSDDIRERFLSRIIEEFDKRGWNLPENYFSVSPLVQSNPSSYDLIRYNLILEIEAWAKKVTDLM